MAFFHGYTHRSPLPDPLLTSSSASAESASSESSKLSCSWWLASQERLPQSGTEESVELESRFTSIRWPDCPPSAPSSLSHCSIWSTLASWGNYNSQRGRFDVPTWTQTLHCAKKYFCRYPITNVTGTISNKCHQNTDLNRIQWIYLYHLRIEVLNILQEETGQNLLSSYHHYLLQVACWSYKVQLVMQMGNAWVFASLQNLRQMKVPVCRNKKCWPAEMPIKRHLARQPKQSRM